MIQSRHGNSSSAGVNHSDETAAGRASDGFWSYGISSTRDGVSRSVKISSLIQQAFELHVTDAVERATVVGWATIGGVYAFNVVDLTNGNLLEEIADPYVENLRTRRLDAAGIFLSHTWDHYGQIVEYLRMNNLRPPGHQ